MNRSIKNLLYLNCLLLIFNCLALFVNIIFSKLKIKTNVMTEYVGETSRDLKVRIDEQRTESSFLVLHRNFDFTNGTLIMKEYNSLRRENFENWPHKGKDITISNRQTRWRINIKSDASLDMQVSSQTYIHIELPEFLSFCLVTISF